MARPANQTSPKPHHHSSRRKISTELLVIIGSRHRDAPRPFAQGASRVPTSSPGQHTDASQPRPRPMTVGASRMGQRSAPINIAAVRVPCTCTSIHPPRHPGPSHHLPSRSGPASSGNRPSAAPRLGVPDHRSVSSRNRRSSNPSIHRDRRPGQQDVNCHRPKTLRPQIRGKLPPDRGQEDRLLRRLHEAAGASRVRATTAVVHQQVRGGVRCGRAQGEAGHAGRGGAGVRGSRGHVHPRGGRERRRGAALLLPRGFLLHLRRQDVDWRGRPVGGVVPRRGADGTGVPPHLHLLPQGGLRHPYPQGGGPVLEI